ncbi:MAG: winged helix-turn-helix transcriptional regulator [Niastella sp.]|uniref:winged helix-turn-helix transcriptional regulator n=1 Tax=Niastella sp. TaxID=1869183 RepID=UPI00389A0E0E
MAPIKTSSTNQLNKRIIATKCPVTFTLHKISGRWKPLIIYQLMSGVKRYYELKNAIPGISEKMLFQHLKEMEADNIISRKATDSVPPQVEYSLTRCGLDLSPVLLAMKEWGKNYNI